MYIYQAKQEAEEAQRDPQLGHKGQGKGGPEASKTGGRNLH